LVQMMAQLKLMVPLNSQAKAKRMEKVLVQANLLVLKMELGISKEPLLANYLLGKGKELENLLGTLMEVIQLERLMVLELVQVILLVLLKV